METRALIIYAYILISACLFIEPLYPKEQLLQNAHFPVAAFLLWRMRRNVALSLTGYTCIVLFLLLHALGARWIYSFVPYDSWFGIDEMFGFKRNMFDRFVHFMFGILLFFPASDVFQLRFNTKVGAAGVLSLIFILASSAFYEVFEWLIAVVLSPEQAEAYNGQQGDVWDGQKDMALAMLGAMVGFIGSGIAMVRSKN